MLPYIYDIMYIKKKTNKKFVLRIEEKEMNTYYGCGILKDIPYIIDNPGDFQIQDLGQNNPDRYIYQGDSIKYELDSELVFCIVDI